ncbi:GlsB/YeaQ/YmgE family stress response membrane protein [Candidatus Electronema sp. PJ]|uniref:GlsB/YeaQ/YmgE family stress response membrane protein n=1 Tax=Candidatus Electronema sp. PJ TaxID=3401572 RepID=UPI003AA7F111
MALLIFLAIGALAGWLAGKLMKGSGFGLLGNIVVGILGAVIGGWLFGQLGIHVGNDFIGALVTSVAGASLLLFVVGLIKK